MIIACPKCKSKYQLRDDARTEKVTCKKCQATIDVKSSVVSEPKTVITHPGPKPSTASAEVKTVITRGGAGSAVRPAAAGPAHEEAALPGAVEKPVIRAAEIAASEEAAGAPDPLVGQTLGGYQILRKLGQGGMGAVYEARQLSLDRSVALKVLPAQLAENKSFIVRFMREALSVAKLNHPNIIQIYDVGKAGGTYFFAMEFVRGTTLGSMLEKQGRMDPATAAGFIIQAARGLEYAHKKNIIHRDIKPDNIMVNEDGIAKVADLGLAKDVQEEASVTMSGVAMGTPHYMAPEQASDAKRADRRADIYSLGCTLYHLVVGRVPYDGSSAFEIITKHVSGPIVTAASVCPDVPEKLSQIIARMMSKKREERYSDMGEVVKALEEYLGVSYGVKGFQPSEQQISALQQHAKAIGQIRRDKMAKLAFLGVAALTVLVFLASLFVNWRFAAGVAMFSVAAPLACEGVIGQRRKSYIYRRLRKYLFGSRITDWLLYVIVAAVVFGLLIVFKLLTAALVALILAFGAAAGWYFGLVRPRLARLDAALEEARKFIRDLRRKGLPEEDIHVFICEHGGADGEFMCEEMFGYEAVLAARARQPEQRVERRPIGVKMRDWLISKLDDAEAKREGKPLAAPAETPTAAATPGQPEKTVVMPQPGAPAAVAAQPAGGPQEAVSAASAEQFLMELDRGRTAKDIAMEFGRFLIGRKGRIAIGAILLLLSALSIAGKMFAQNAVLGNFNFTVFALALLLTGCTRTRLFLIALILACIISGPVAIWAAKSGSVLGQSMNDLAANYGFVRQFVDAIQPHVRPDMLQRLSATAALGALVGLAGFVLQFIIGDI